MHQKFCWMLYKWASYILEPRALKKESGFSNRPSINVPSDGFLILKVNSFSWGRICFSSSTAPGLSRLLLFSMVENFPIFPYYLSYCFFCLHWFLSLLWVSAQLWKLPLLLPVSPAPLSALKLSSHYLDAGEFIFSLDPELKGRDEILFHTTAYSTPLHLAQGLFSGRCSNVGGSSEWTLFAFYLWLCRNQRKSHLSSQKREHIQIPRTAVPGKTF